MNHSFGTWVKRRRKALDITQNELAARVGCSPSLIFKIESDERRPSRQIAELLAQHLEIPSDQRDLFLKIARQEKAIDELDSLSPLSVHQPDSPSPRHPPPLPFSPNPLVGREFELAEIARLIQDPHCRLLTLTGPGGIGKTRLALEVAHQIQSNFKDGAFFISLVGVSSPEYLVSSIADALEFSFAGSTEPQTQLLAHLRGKDALLVLDNMEHLLDGVELLSELLPHATGVKLLVTSREPLRLQAEWNFEVQGLPVPEADRLEELEASSAAALFLQRARQVKANFALPAEDSRFIFQICRLVEGLPLGLELAASWVRVMSPNEIAQEIERSMDFLTTTARDVPARHRSIRAVFDHSWNLLSDEEKRILRQLAVFSGGFTRSAAEEVAGATLPQLSALVDKTLLRYAKVYTGWYEFHELVRQYVDRKAKDNLEEHDRLHERHASYYASWLHQFESRLHGPEQQEILNQIGLEIDNIRSAWGWMVKHCQIEHLQRSLASLFVLHDIRNWLHQGSALFEQAATAVQSHEKGNERKEARDVLLGELMVCQGHMCWHLGDMRKARDLLQHSLGLLGVHRRRPMLAEAFLFLSILELSQGDYPAARKLAEECVALNREQSRSSGTGYALSNLGMVCLAQGEYDNAYAYLKESVSVMRSINHTRGIAVAVTRLGAAALQLGRHAEARQLLEESLQITRTFNDRWGIGNALNFLGWLAFAEGDLAGAESLIRDSVALFKEDGDQIMLASTLADLGYLLNERNAVSDSRDAFREALQIAMRIRAIPVALNALVGIASLYAKDGDPERALEGVIHGGGHPSSTQQTKDRAQALRAALGAQLSPEKTEAIQAQAREKTLEVLVSEMLGA